MTLDFKSLYNREEIFPRAGNNFGQLFPIENPIVDVYSEFIEVIILDRDNKILLNTTADEYLETQIEGILKYLEEPIPSL